MILSQQRNASSFYCPYVLDEPTLEPTLPLNRLTCNVTEASAFLLVKHKRSNEQNSVYTQQKMRTTRQSLPEVRTRLVNERQQYKRTAAQTHALKSLARAKGTKKSVQRAMALLKKRQALNVCTVNVQRRPEETIVVVE